MGGRVVEGDSLQNCRVILRVGSNPTPSAKLIHWNMYVWWSGLTQRAATPPFAGSNPAIYSENFHGSSDICGTVFDRKKVILGVVQLVERLLWEQEVFRRFEPCYPDK